MTRTDKEQAVKYLMGDLTDVERDTIEEHFFTDENFSRFIDDAENDLIDDFVRGELSEREMQLFLRNFLVSERRHEKVRTAQVFQNELFAETKRSSFVPTANGKTSFRTALREFFRAPQIAFAAFALLLLMFGGWFGLKYWNTPEIVKIEESNSPIPQISEPPAGVQSNQTNIDLPNTNSFTDKSVIALTNKTANANQIKPSEKPANGQKLKSSAMQATLATLLLLPATRGSQSPSLTLRANVSTVNLQIVNDRGEDFDLFRVEVRNIDGALISAQNFKNTNYNRKNFNLQIPSQKLAAADYQVTLKGADIGAEFQNLNYFYFSIDKKITR